MKLIGNLKKQVDDATDKDTKRNLIEKAGMKLTDDELEMVCGGGDGHNLLDGYEQIAPLHTYLF